MGTIYRADTILNGKQCVLLDIGLMGNLAGDGWARSVAEKSRDNGGTSSTHKRERPLVVNGVGHGSQQAHYSASLPLAFKASRLFGMPIEEIFQDEAE